MIPPKYQIPPHKTIIENILKFLLDHKKGKYAEEIVTFCSISRHKCTEYLTVLVKSDILLRVNNKVLAS